MTHSEDSRRYWEEKRLLFLLGSTSILFFVCITPQLVLSLMIHEAVLESYPFQVTMHKQSEVEEFIRVKRLVF